MKMRLLTNKLYKSYLNQTVTLANKVKDKYNNDKKYRRVNRNYCHHTGKYSGATLSICILESNLPKEIHVVFDNVSNCDYHFFIKELAKEFEGELDN